MFADSRSFPGGFGSLKGLTKYGFGLEEPHTPAILRLSGGRGLPLVSIASTEPFLLPPSSVVCCCSSSWVADLSSNGRGLNSRVNGSAFSNSSLSSSQLGIFLSFVSKPSTLRTSSSPLNVSAAGTSTLMSKCEAKCMCLYPWPWQGKL